MAVHSPAELRDLIVHLLAGATGKSEKHWRAVIGDVDELPLAFNIKCNWRVCPKGSPLDVATVGTAVELVRKEHPYVGSTK